jgi:uncharacterized protein (DUF58 family)
VLQAAVNSLQRRESRLVTTLDPTPMNISFVPSFKPIAALGALTLLSSAALLAGASSNSVSTVVGVMCITGLIYAIGDLWRSRRAWQRAPLQWQRELPAALALGATRHIDAVIINTGQVAWQVQWFDHVDATLTFEGLPQSLRVPAARKVRVQYSVQPVERGLVHFQQAELRIQTLGGCWQMRCRLGEVQSLRVYPNFAAVARYAWLAGDQRLAEIGIKSRSQRGLGTDFKQLSDYRPGDAVRHIDWRATLRHARPVVREFQDERDQTVLLLLDNSRHMRAREAQAGQSHFDAALNAVMLLAYIALKDGDAVDAMTFSAADEVQRQLAPRKGASTFNALMSRLYDAQAQPTHADFVALAERVMQQQRKRAVIVLLSNFKDEDTSELEAALDLLGTRHQVIMASLRERALGEVMAQPLLSQTQALEVASAHVFAQSRQTTLRRLQQKHPHLIDVEPQNLAVELVNQYRRVKPAR